MQQRINYGSASPGAVRAMRGVEAYLAECSLDRNLLELVKMRVSQINGCAYCLDMHSKELRAAGETEQRLYLLDAWREAPLYTDRERAALAWAEAMTHVTEGHVPDAVFEQARAQFSETELVDLSLAITQINAWNRFSIGFRVPAGSYEVRKR